MDKKSAPSQKVEWLNDVFSVSLNYHPVKLRPLLMEMARYNEVRRQLIRKRNNVRIDLVNGPVLARNDITHDRPYHQYLIRLQKRDGKTEYLPLNKLPYLVKDLGLYIGKSEKQFEEEARKAEQHIWDYFSEKLGYSLLQFLFEALHAATGSPVSEEKQKELEKIGSMVNKCRGLRLAGKNSPAGLRRGDKRELEELVKLSMLVLGQRNQSITYDTAANFLQTNFEFVPTLTGETLRKAVSHHALNWKQMKMRKT
jgi:hypothetical protein